MCVCVCFALQFIIRLVCLVAYLRNNDGPCLTLHRVERDGKTNQNMRTQSFRRIVLRVFEYTVVLIIIDIIIYYIKRSLYNRAVYV